MKNLVIIHTSIPPPTQVTNHAVKKFLHIIYEQKQDQTNILMPRLVLWGFHVNYFKVSRC